MPKPSRKTCFYCNAVLTAKFENDHFPIPARHGGTATVPACESCHTMKDRTPLDMWDDTWVEDVSKDFEKLGRATKIFLAKAMCVVLDNRGLGPPIP